jgi:membrane protein DedA with SNARE-associated domain
LSITSSIFNFAVNLVEKSGYAGVFGLMIVASAAVPIPSEVILPVAGYLVSIGQLSFWVVVALAATGSLIGTLIAYSIGYFLGRAAILRYGRYIRMNEGHLNTAEKWFARYGSVTVLFCQFVPLIRTLVPFPAGIAEMKLWKFVVFSLVGIVIWDTLLVYIGYYVGTNYLAISRILEGDFTDIGILAIVIAIVVIAFFVTRRSSSQTKQEKPESAGSSTRSQSGI